MIAPLCAPVDGPRIRAVDAAHQRSARDRRLIAAIVPTAVPAAARPNAAVIRTN